MWLYFAEWNDEVRGGKISGKAVRPDLAESSMWGGASFWAPIRIYHLSCIFKGKFNIKRILYIDRILIFSRAIENIFMETATGKWRLMLPSLYSCPHLPSGPRLCPSLTSQSRLLFPSSHFWLNLSNLTSSSLVGLEISLFSWDSFFRAITD